VTENYKMFGVILTIYYLGNQINNNEMGRACGMCGERGLLYRVLEGKTEGKRQLERPGTKWE
jgi:hypothetical protein